MNSNQRLNTKLLACALAAAITGAVHASEANYCIAANGGFNGDGGGTSFIGKGFTVPAAGNCKPWSGFTKTASTVVLTTTGTGCHSSDGKVLTVSVSSADPDFFGALTRAHPSLIASTQPPFGATSFLNQARFAPGGG
jgi:hypothetical protein